MSCGFLSKYILTATREKEIRNLLTFFKKGYRILYLRNFLTNFILDYAFYNAFSFYDCSTFFFGNDFPQKHWNTIIIIVFLLWFFSFFTKIKEEKKYAEVVRHIQWLYKCHEVYKGDIKFTTMRKNNRKINKLDFRKNR